MATISIADNDARIQHSIGSGGNTPDVTQYTIDFPFFSLDDINVIITSSGTDTTLTRGTGAGTFAVTGTTVDDGFSGGYITLGSAYTSVTVTIIRDIAISRTSDFATSGPFNISSLNTDLDKIYAVMQQLETKNDRALTMADSDDANTIQLPNKANRIGTVLAFNATTGDAEPGPSIGSVTTVASQSANINTLAGIDSDITTVSGISSNVTTVAGISANVTTVAGITSNIAAVVADESDIGTVATNIASVNTVATNIADVITVANDLNEAVSEVVTVADDLNEAVSEIDTVAGSISNVDTVGANISNVNTVAGISSNVTTVAGVSANVTTVAGISGNVSTVAGISSDVTTVAADGTDIGTVATNITNVNTVAGISSNVTTVAGISANVTSVAGNATNINTVAGDTTAINAVASDATDIGTVATNIANVNTVAGISANVTTVAGDSANIGTIATDLNGSDNIGIVGGAITNVNLVGGSITNVNTVANNLTSVNSFADTYSVGATDPTTNLNTGDLFYNTTSSTLKVYTGSAWEQGVTAGSGFLPLSGGALTGNLTLGDNVKAIFGTGSDLEIYHDGSNSIIKDGGTGNLQIQADDFKVMNSSGTENVLFGAEDGLVRLFYNSATKLETKSDGVDITGELQTDTLDVDGTSNFADDITLVGASIAIGDNEAVRFGAGQDLTIFHDAVGGGSYINESGGGNLIITGTNIEFKNTGSTSTLATLVNGGAVNLYYNGSKKFETKSDGVDISGELQSDSLDVDGNADIAGTLAVGGHIDVPDNIKMRFGASDDLQIYHDGNDSYINETGTGNLRILSQNFKVAHTNNGEAMINANIDAAVELFYDANKKFETVSDGIYVTGNVQSSSGAYEGASDQDKIVVGASQIDFYINNSNEFRMESDGDFHADGDVIAYSTTVSDERLKTDIEKIENATDKVSQLNGYTFTYKADGKKSAGVIAQEVEKVLPSAVSEKELPLKMDDGVAYKTVQYDQIIGLLIESIKELKQEINELKGV